MAGEKTINDITFRIRHTMMLVSDLDRSMDFYTRLLGMDVQRIRPNPDKSERVGYVGYGSEDEYPGLELIETGGPGRVKEMPKWHGHVAIFVSDLYKLSAKLQAEGMKFTPGAATQSARQPRSCRIYSRSGRVYPRAHRATCEERPASENHVSGGSILLFGNSTKSASVIAKSALAYFVQCV